ncbi:trypsin-like peptidase domain-containing protein [Bradyrhizobium sp. SRL28]|uniref:S1 family peptidase n=1 Tax=Bradyrhizobium sp. SRL28 TaxID=2836178 RepID=UPI001BDDCEEB|nr:serine protease [Bradyrhizobium sp. SRL28]MBT1514366.1 trypsin-like peptidase domain-containing protein [Bradyrhizobium sp. SRL28]
MAYIDICKPDGSRGIGSAFHVGNNVFVTARHVVENNEILEIKITEPIGISAEEYFRDVLKLENPDERAEQHKKAWGAERTTLMSHWLEPLKIIEGPKYHDHPDVDVAVFRVEKTHANVGAIKLGVHFDDWVYRGNWQLSDAIVLGYPPIPLTNSPALIAARAEINAFVVPRHAPFIHFILSATPRGGFSGGVAIHEDGDALGVITSSFLDGDLPEQIGFFAVLSIEAIIHCLAINDLYPDFQRQHHKKILGIDPLPWIAIGKKETN